MLQIKDIKKEYKTGSLVQKALDGVSLNLRDSEFVAVLGPSGSGKTTLLNIIGGLDRYDSGELIINGISTKKYRDRDWDSYRNHTIGFVFQSYNLIPHQSILSNVELALTISGAGKEERTQRAKEALEKVGLGDQLHKRPGQLSGGQMQRVAIARALVNDPDILLADEPTGALDSETSLQVMDLLRQVAEDRLVVMVTHNPELADAYATRIVRLKDGKIISDSDAFNINEDEMEEPEHRNMGKASMSFLTALSLSFNNLRTKKARTLLTSFAGSIGIIGIALILSLSNGVNTYIESLETETMAEYPLQIQKTGLDFTSMMSAEGGGSGAEDEEGEVSVMSMVTDMFSTTTSNDLRSFKKYLESGESDIEQYTNAIEYSYSASPQIYRLEGSEARQVHPDTSFEALGLGSSTGSNSMMSTMMSTDVFYEMPENDSLYKGQYDVKAGRWPESYDECVVVLTSGGGISDFLLYTLGLRDSSELDEMIRQFVNEENVDTPETMGSYSYEDLMKASFKTVNAADCYRYDSQYQVWTDRSDDEAYMRELAENGEDLKVVGVVQPSEDGNGFVLSSGIGYTPELTRHMSEAAGEKEIVRQQLADRNINVFTGKPFGEEASRETFDMGALFSVDESRLSQAFTFDESALSGVLGGGADLGDLIDMDNISLELPEGEASLGDMMGDIDISVSSEGLSRTVTELMEGYRSYVETNPPQDPSDVEASFKEYLATDEAGRILSEGLSSAVDAEAVEGQIMAAVERYMQEVMSSYGNALNKAVEEQVSSAMGQMAEQMTSGLQNAVSINPSAFAEAFKINMSPEELTSLMMSMSSEGGSSYEGNLAALGYVDFDDPSAIDIYPVDFESKEQVVSILDNYNSRMEAEGEEEKVITYTDLVGSLMSSVTEIINAISYVLIAFVAISLVVSSIMIGVITYISVLERKKEIGILRAIGASKQNISQVFNAETFIIGLCAGIIGIGISLLLLIPGNAAIHYVAGTDEVSAILPPLGAVILILLSVALTLIGGLIPSRKAAKSDPVAALRTE
ncbi:MAG TPA: ABC transporter ATP-binding protein/permease [Candidatus Copromorpha excrementigallinarum]|uniref:ABC transporter ATP-binding protein/permease n=1 Tax=Candidatus Allocopromorpha excrementigallinarum TaxID=2840742 RepID=A0A9D1L6I8_9FIRM|nr:ABC transporter ATP-binding protein/permease [Candidatus Copromorpha excrementigallinarum]